MSDSTLFSSSKTTVSLNTTPLPILALLAFSLLINVVVGVALADTVITADSRKEIQAGRILCREGNDHRSKTRCWRQKIARKILNFFIEILSNLVFVKPSSIPSLKFHLFFLLNTLYLKFYGKY